MKAIKFLIILPLLITLIKCAENENEAPEPITSDSPDLPLTDDQEAFLASLPDTVIQSKDIILENGQTVLDFLEQNDPEFLQAHPNGRLSEAKSGNPYEQKLRFLARMFHCGSFLVDDEVHTYPAAGSNGPAQTGLAYSWGSKDENKRQIPPGDTDCKSQSIYGLDCSGMLWVMTQWAGVTVEPKRNFFVQYISDASKWTKAFKASHDYKDLEMRDLGQLPKNEIKNGDIILWKQHVGVYLYGSIFQSNGSSKKPNCLNNLQPDKGPRILPLANILAWDGLGSYKVFRITHEYYYTFEIETSVDFICGFPGQIYHDGVTMEVHVKGDSVEISNIVNQAASVNPVVLAVPDDCTMTCDPGSTGIIDVISGTGEVHESRFYIELQNRASPTGRFCTYECSDQDPTTVSTPEPDYEHFFEFVLADSAQTYSASAGAFVSTVRLTPK